MIRSGLVQAMAAIPMGTGELAEKTGISRSTISRMRSNVYPTRIEIDTLDRICKVLGCKIQDLLEYVEN